MDEESRLAMETVERDINEQRKVRKAIIIFAIVVGVTNAALLIVNLACR